MSHHAVVVLFIVVLQEYYDCDCLCGYWCRRGGEIVVGQRKLTVCYNGRYRFIVIVVVFIGRSYHCGRINVASSSLSSFALAGMSSTRKLSKGSKKTTPILRYSKVTIQNDTPYETTKGPSKGIVRYDTLVYYSAFFDNYINRKRILSLIH